MYSKYSEMPNVFKFVEIDTNEKGETILIDFGVVSDLKIESSCDIFSSLQIDKGLLVLFNEKSNKAEGQ